MRWNIEFSTRKVSDLVLQGDHVEMRYFKYHKIALVRSSDSEHQYNEIKNA